VGDNEVIVAGGGWSVTFPASSRGVGGLEVELAFALLVEDAIAAGAAAADVHPVAGIAAIEPASAPVYQMPLMITFLSSLLCEWSGLSLSAGTLRICV
jgi:hypothetical protein